MPGVPSLTRDIFQRREIVENWVSNLKSVFPELHVGVPQQSKGQGECWVCVLLCRVCMGMETVVGSLKCCCYFLEVFSR